MAFTFFEAVSASISAWSLFVCITAFAGGSMGAVGVGGVLIVPGMIAVLAVDPKVAVASTILAFIMTAVAGVYTYRDILSQHARQTGSVSFGAGVGGLTASFALRSITSESLSMGIAGFCVCFGFKVFFQLARASPRRSLETTAEDVGSSSSPPFPDAAWSRSFLSIEEMRKVEDGHLAEVRRVASHKAELRSFLENLRGSRDCSSNPSRPLPVLDRLLAFGIESIDDLEDSTVASDVHLVQEAGLSLREVSCLRALLAQRPKTPPPSNGTSLLALEAGDATAAETARAPTEPSRGRPPSEGNDGSTRVEEGVGENKNRGAPEEFKTVALGAFVGFGSALTGTMGAVLLLPTLLLWRPHTTPNVAVALSMAVGLPMALATTAASVLVADQTVDAGLSLVVGVVSGISVALGRRGTQLLEAKWAKEDVNRILLGAIAAVLVATGVYVLVVTSKEIS